ncbi:amino acid adenylation domain-containing protein [Plantactinospora sp. B6F1]|uniref:amino acid adenylation domain-containing protein n=1 Tax=Plantactinospora sp. B6F1 TaxID=3158971 RepID=UPI0032D90C55
MPDTIDDTAGVPQMRAGLSPARAALLRRWTQGRSATEVVVPRRRGTGPAPLSFSQERLWILDRLLGAGHAYNTIPLVARLRGPLDVTLFERSLAAVAARHEVMRSRIELVDGEPVQVVLPNVPIVVDAVDLRAVPDPAAEALRLARAQRGESFDLATGPLFRTRLFRVADDEHILLHLMHHTISDGWSDDVLIREIAAVYRALADGRSPDLPALPIQYADYAVWQRQRLTGEHLDRLLGYWRDRLEDAPRALDLPTDRPRPAVQRLISDTRTVRVPAGVTGRLKALAREADATLFMVVLAAVDVLLARYSGQTDIVVGSPVANRTQSQTERLIGCFVNTLVLRCDLDGNPTFRRLLGRVRQVALGAYHHQELPFERLVEELQPDRDSSRNPLFQVMVALQNSPPADLTFGSFRLSPIELDNGVAKFDITVDLREFEGELVGRIQFDADLFDPQTCDRMSAHLGTLLAGIAAAPDTAIADLPLLDEAQLDLLTRQWNDTAADHDLEPLHRTIERWAATRPDAIAVTAPDGQLTYRELNARAERLAARLHRAGAGPDVLIGLCVQRSVLLPLGILGILKAGAAYLPLDPAHPAERIEYMLRDAAVPLVVSTTGNAGLLPRSGPPAILLDEVPEQPLPAVPVAPAGGPAGLDNLAYVIYTSGSTGRPKGVMISHRAVANMIRSTLDEIGTVDGDAVLQFATVCFDVSVLEIFGALCSGARLVVPDGETVLDPAALTGLTRREQVTVADIPPAVLHMLDPAAMPSLRIQFIGCEAFGGPLATRWQQPGRRLINGYGPTEATVMMTLMELDQPYERMPPIGRPMPNHQVHLLDQGLRPVPVGVPGELYIGGTGLARGYLNRPGLTADRFVPDGYGGTPGARLYRTGDLARHRADGILEFVGRADRQVKIRGLRIEVGEIEAVLEQHPAVSRAVVVVRETPAESKHLVAYAQPEAGEPAGPDELRDWLRRRLPSYMEPRLIVPVDELPLMPSGKVDRAALPDPDKLAAPADRPHTPPRTDLERTLLEQVFGVVLGTRDIDVNESFFQLGGNSLQLAHLQSRIVETLGVEIPLRTLFATPTVAALAGHLADLVPADPTAPARDLADGERVPLTAQQRWWWRTAGRYNKPMAARLRGFVDPEAVTGAVRQVVARHETLRTTFDTDGPEPVGVVHADLPPDVAEVDLSDAGWSAVAEAFAAEVAHIFDLRHGPLVRLRLLRLAPYDQLIVVTVHPLLWDGWSRAVLAHELLSFADAVAVDEPPAALPIQYRHCAYGQADETANAESLAYWTGVLAGAPAPLALPGRETATPAAAPRPGATHRFAVDEKVTAALDGVQRETGASMFVLTFTAFVVTLSAMTGEQDVVVGVPLANRVRPGTAGLVGNFVSTMPLRIRLTGLVSLRDVLDQVRERVVEAYAHQEVPAEALCLALDPDGARLPFGITFDLLTEATRLRPAPGIDLTPVELDTAYADFDLTLAMERRPDGLHGTVSHATDAYPAATAVELADRYGTVLSALARDPRTGIAELHGAARAVVPELST